MASSMKTTERLAKAKLHLTLSQELAKVPDDAHPYIAPGLNVQGLCPALNTLANRAYTMPSSKCMVTDFRFANGYISRDGVTTFAEPNNHDFNLTIWNRLVTYTREFDNRLFSFDAFKQGAAIRWDESKATNPARLLLP